MFSLRTTLGGTGALTPRKWYSFGRDRQTCQNTTLRQLPAWSRGHRLPASFFCFKGRNSGGWQGPGERIGPLVAESAPANSRMTAASSRSSKLPVAAQCRSIKLVPKISSRRPDSIDVCEKRACLNQASKSPASEALCSLCVSASKTSLRGPATSSWRSLRPPSSRPNK